MVALAHSPLYKLPAALSIMSSASARTAGVWAREKPLWPGAALLGVGGQEEPTFEAGNAASSSV